MFDMAERSTGKKPGVMIYFDLRPCLKRLNLEEKGRLFEAILDYAEDGVIPELDGICGVAWDFLRPRIDRDSSSYEKSCVKKRYAAYCRDARKRNLTPMTFDEWEATSFDST